MTAPRPRVLEIGMFCLLKQAWPETTTFVYAGPQRFALPDGLPRRFRARDWLRPGAVDLVVAHTGSEDPWRPGVLARLLSPRRRADAVAALTWDILRQVRPQLGSIPLAVLDMHDERTIHGRDIALLEAGTRYFKRELPPDPLAAFSPRLRTAALRAAMHKVRPISLGLSAATLAEVPSPLPEKAVDIFFGGSVRHGAAIRAPGLAELERLQASGVSVDIAHERLARPEFLARCARARLVWSPEGLGWDCFRHYEAAVCGAVPLINTPSIRRHAPLVHGVHAIHYDVEEGGLTRAALEALTDRDRLDAMGRLARTHVLAHHTHSALCNYIVRECLP